MAYLAIVKVEPTGRVGKYQGYPTEAEAIAHVERVKAQFPSAYVAPMPANEQYSTWLCDPVAKTIAVSIPPPTKDEINHPLLRQIVAKERLTDRRVREMVLRWARGSLAANDADRVALEARETEFAALRAQLVP